MPADHEAQRVSVGRRNVGSVVTAAADLLVSARGSGSVRRRAEAGRSSCPSGSRAP